MHDYKDIAPYWLIDSAYTFIYCQLKELRIAIESDDNLGVALSNCTAFSDLSPATSAIPESWGISDAKQWVAVLRRDMRRAEKAGDWKQVASRALEIGEHEAAIAQMRVARKRNGKICE